MAIILIAFLIRFVFAYGISAGNDYALSGGSSASSHLNTIISILNGTFVTSDSALNYPIGSLNVLPPLMDFILAGVAGLVSVFGVSTATAAAGTLAWSTPIIAALTCYPVYLVAKKMFKNDEKIGMLAALMYALFALLIMTSVFSNGTEYAFIGFMFAWLVYFMLKAMECLDENRETGFGRFFADKALLKNVVIAGILFALIALSWNQFRVILVTLVIMMFAQALIDRFRSKDFSLTVLTYSVVILIGILASAPYYIVAGLWDAVFSGPFVIAIFSVVLAIVFALTANKTWALMIPALIIATVAFFVALLFAAPSLYDAVIYGNSFYNGTLMNAIMASTHTSISAMASYYGWLTMWAPLLMFIFMVYKARKHIDSKKYLFTALFLISMFFIGWYAVSNAVVAGIGFAVASSAGLIYVIRKIDVFGYLKGIKGGDSKAKLKKIFKPVPFATVVLLAIVVVAPNIVYAVDAATPTNSESSGDYFGGLGYTISTVDTSTMNKVWADYSDEEKSGAIVTWLTYSNDAAYKGGFNSITDNNGGGASAMANILLANGSAGATAVMALRMILSGDLADYKTAITNAGLDYAMFEKYVNDPSLAVKEVRNNGSTYPGISSNVTEENALYLVLGQHISSTLTEPDVDKFYDGVCAIGGSINYVAVNGSMLPMYYRDGSYFPTIAYFNNYVTDSYGAPSKYFSYNTQTGYATYTAAMYETFLWKSLIGPSPAYYGFTSSINMLNALAISDGTVKAIPGYGLGNYVVDTWYVQYNADKKATLTSSGWETIDGYKAIEKQNNEGGVINYLAGVVVMKYSDSASTTLSGTVNYTDANGNAKNAAGVEVAVYKAVNYDSEGVIKYVPYSVVKTLENGTYKVSVPATGEYYITFSSGATTSTEGVVLETYTNASDVPSVYNIDETSLGGQVVCNDKTYTAFTYVELKGQTSGLTVSKSTVDGLFSFKGLIPDTYKVTLTKADGSVISSSTLTVTEGDNSGARIDATSGKIVATIYDEYGATITSGTVSATDVNTGNIYYAEVQADGTATFNVVPGTYNIAGDDRVSLNKSTVVVSKGGSKTTTLTTYDAKTISVSGAPSGALITISSLGFMTSGVGTAFNVPVGGGSGADQYTAYAIVDGKVYYGTTTGTSITMTSGNALKVTGVLKTYGGDTAEGTVAFINATGAVYVISTDAKGAYTAYLPNGTYSVYAYDKSGSAYLSTHTITNDTTLDINMEKSRTISVSLQYYSYLTSKTSTKGIAFVDVTFKVGDHTVVLKTSANSPGKAYFYMPVDRAVTASIAGFDTTEFYSTGQSKSFEAGTSSDSVTWTLDANPEKNKDMHAKTVNVFSEYEVTLTSYADKELKYTFKGNQNVLIGRYTAVVNGSTGYYFDGAVYVYPGQSGHLVMDGKEVITVTIKADEKDKLTVNAVENDEGKTGTYYKDADNKLVYYVEKGFNYYFTAKSVANEKQTIAYGNVDNASANVTLDLSSKSEIAKIYGYVGVEGDGTVTMSYGSVSIDFPVKAGAFTLDVPKGAALDLSVYVTVKDANDENLQHVYQSSKSLASEAVVDKAHVNMFSMTTGAEDKTVLSGSSYSFKDGKGSFTLNVKNNDDFANTYYVVAGSAWNLYKTSTVVVKGNSTGSVEVSGFYNAAKVGAGNEDLSVTVYTITGTKVGTLVLDGSGFSSGTATTTYVDVTGTEGAKADAIGTYEYLYAVSFKNDDSFYKYATLTVTVDDPKWIVALADENQYSITSSGDGYKYKINGFDTTAVYVKVMCPDGSSTTVPNVTINVTVDGASTLATNSGSVKVNGTTATMTLSPQTVELDSSDMNATGNDISNSASTVPASFWIAMALCVVMLIFVAWMGSKRGVFARKK
jgi:asparagine N-glycosylation enzyme membrane subunit Stt3